MEKGAPRLKIPPELLDDVKAWNEDDVELFLAENKKAYRIKEVYIQAIKDQELCGNNLLHFELQHFRDCGVPLGPAANIFDLVTELKIAKRLVLPGT